MKRYFIDIACLQETKIKNGLNSENITCFPTKEDAYGLGLIVNQKWKNNITSNRKKMIELTYNNLILQTSKNQKNIPTQ